MENYKKRILSAVPVLVLMVIIFSFSAQPSQESNVSSNYIVDKIIEIVDEIEETMGIESNHKIFAMSRDTLTFIVRKLAHTFEYMALGISLCFFWYQNQWRRHRLIIVTLISGFLYACSDELHQYFVPGRSCEFRDVLIDTNGVFIGTLIFSFVLWNLYRRNKKCAAKVSS